jgi:iron(III) transport system substrate-binding protein
MCRNKKLELTLLTHFLAIAAMGSTASAESVLNVYSHRHYGVDEQVNALFTERTGIEVRVVNADADQLIERLRSEGANSPADVLVTVDSTRMERARGLGLLQKFDTPGLELPPAPEGLNDPDGYWHPYTIRARVILTAKGRVKPGEITRYEDLAKPQWRGRLLIRSSTSNYNQALMAAMVAANGEAEATSWARGVANNLARPPQGGDRDQIKAVAAGLADVCVSNSYYLGMMLESSDPAERAAARKVDLVFPNQADRGTHANVSAIALLKHADNAEAARRYLQFLLSPEIQSMLAKGTYEHPINLDSTLTEAHRAWGEFKIDTQTFGELPKHHEAAIRMFDAARWR